MINSFENIKQHSALWLEQFLPSSQQLDYRETCDALLRAASIQRMCTRNNTATPEIIFSTLCDRLMHTSWECIDTKAYFFTLSQRTKTLILSDAGLLDAVKTTRLAHRFALVNALLFDVGVSSQSTGFYEDARAWEGRLPKKPKVGVNVVSELISLWSRDPERGKKWTFLRETEKIFEDNIQRQTDWRNSNVDDLLNLAFNNEVPGASEIGLVLPTDFSF
jgi:hypothetical protein